MRPASRARSKRSWTTAYFVRGSLASACGFASSLLNERLQTKRARRFASRPSFVRLRALVFHQQRPESRVLPDRLQVMILAHVAEITVPQLHRPPQRPDGLVGSLHQRIRAGEVVVRQRV